MSPSTCSSNRSQSGSSSAALDTSDLHYRLALRLNGIVLDHTGAAIPPEIRQVLDTQIFKPRTAANDEPPPPSPEAVARAVATAVSLANSLESTVRDLLLGTALFPINSRTDVAVGGHAEWQMLLESTQQRSGNHGGLCADDMPRLPRPRPDPHVGYRTNETSPWTEEELLVTSHAYATEYLQPSGANCLPFLVLEVEAEAVGGTLWHAENRAAASGAICVNARRWLAREASLVALKPPALVENLVDSIAFSACVTHRAVVLHVHHYAPATNLNYMSYIGAYQTVSHVLECNAAINNILDFGMGARQTKIRAEIGQLFPVPEHWRLSQLAGFMADAGDGDS